MAHMVASVKQWIDNAIDLRPDSRMPAPFQQREGARGGHSVKKSQPQVNHVATLKRKEESEMCRLTSGMKG